METLKEQYQSFVYAVNEGIDIQHSSQDLITVTSVKDFYEADETGCEEYFANSFCTHDVSVEDILNGNVNVETYAFDLAYESWINGQKDQMLDYIEDYSFEDFLDYVEELGSSEYIAIMRHIIYIKVEP